MASANSSGHGENAIDIKSEMVLLLRDDSRKTLLLETPSERERASAKQSKRNSGDYNDNDLVVVEEMP